VGKNKRWTRRKILDFWSQTTKIRIEGKRQTDSVKKVKLEAHKTD
jgi:hypothetical protein